MTTARPPIAGGGGCRDAGRGPEVLWRAVRQIHGQGSHKGAQRSPRAGLRTAHHSVARSHHPAACQTTSCCCRMQHCCVLHEEALHNLQQKRVRMGWAAVRGKIVAPHTAEIPLTGQRVFPEGVRSPGQDHQQRRGEPGEDDRGRREGERTHGIHPRHECASGRREGGRSGGVSAVMTAGLAKWSAEQVTEVCVCCVVKAAGCTAHSGTSVCSHLTRHRCIHPSPCATNLRHNETVEL